MEMMKIEFMNNLVRRIRIVMLKDGLIIAVGPREEIEKLSMSVLWRKFVNMWIRMSRTRSSVVDLLTTFRPFSTESSRINSKQILYCSFNCVMVAIYNLHIIIWITTYGTWKILNLNNNDNNYHLLSIDQFFYF